LKLGIDEFRRALAAIVYVAGVCIVLYVAYLLPYINPEDTRSTIAIEHWGLEAARIGRRYVYVEGGHKMLDHSGSYLSFPNEKERLPVPALPPYINFEPIWEQFVALLPEEREVHHTLWAATAPAYPTERSSRSWFRYWCSAAPIGGSPTRSVRLLRFGTDATSGSASGRWRLCGK
jgi:hypothetical protein